MVGTNMVSANLQAGIEAHVMGSYSQAIKNYDREIKEVTQAVADAQGEAKFRQRQTLVHLLCNRGEALVSLDLIRRALKDADEALTHDADSLRALLLKGTVFEKLNKRKEAGSLYEDASKRACVDDIRLHAELRRRLDTVRRVTSHVKVSNFSTEPVETTPAISPAPTSTPVAVQQNGVPKPASPSPQPPPSVSGATQKIPFGSDQSAQQKDTGIHLGLAKSSSTQSQITPEASAEALAKVAAMGVVQNGVGRVDVDKKIAEGYMLVNSNRIAEAIRLFSDLLEKDKTLLAAYLGRGTGYAIINELQRADEDFTAAININRAYYDSWKRRGQVRAALGREKDAIADYLQATSLQPALDYDTYHQLALVYHRQRNFKKALLYVAKATDIMDKTNVCEKEPQVGRQVWNVRGLCENSMGLCDIAVRSYERAASLDADNADLYAHMGQCMKDWGDYDRSLKYFTVAVEKTPTDKYYHQLAMLHYGVGAIDAARATLVKGLSYNGAAQESWCMRAVSEHGLGMFKAAMKSYDTLIKINPNHMGAYQCEVCLFWHHRLDLPVTDYSMDLDLSPLLKEGWCKKAPLSTIDVPRQPPYDPTVPDVDLTLPPPYNMEAVGPLINMATRLGQRIQYNTPGFLKNAKQQRQVGLAILEVAQTLQKVWTGLRTGTPYIVNNRLSTGARGPHVFGWRDLFDIAVKWRQYSEPNDPVWWVDKLTEEQFEEGFGSHTPMLIGQSKVVRYHPYIQRSFQMIQQLLPLQQQLTQAQRMQVNAARDFKELYDVVHRDFYVVTPCHSSKVQGHVMEGTRLTVQLHEPDGFDVAIKTPGTPPRWNEFASELDHIFTQLCTAATTNDQNIDLCSDLVLAMSFYWYHFMPLSRGTAACGFVALHGTMLALGYEINGPVPTGLQMDWEGILRPTPEDYRSVLTPWMYPARARVDEKEWAALPNVAETFPTLRAIIDVLNRPVF
eukprot:comp19447_c0_seq1/m.22602 comp19447_c0_seq1/g.22602  ORF comp19447_c0_seq1/g.22602 comp19447_c0_seq1/m.22602 type:complete len:961 (-) comp19447_c0_seq1:504-3386(-)